MNSQVTNPKTREWQAMSREHHLAPFSDFKQLAENGPRIITKADGVYLWDSEGNKILDAMAGLWCVAIGYGRKELADAAAKQMQELPYYNMFFQTATPPALELAKAISELAPAGMNHVFFTGSGSEGNDTMLRMVRHYWATKGQPEKQVIIGRINGYHGSTVAGAGLGGMAGMHQQGGLIPDMPRQIGHRQRAAAKHNILALTLLLTEQRLLGIPDLAVGNQRYFYLLLYFGNPGPVRRWPVPIAFGAGMDCQAAGAGLGNGFSIVKRQAGIVITEADFGTDRDVSRHGVAHRFNNTV